MRWTMLGVGITALFVGLWMGMYIGLALLGIDVILAEVVSGLVVLGLMVVWIVWALQRSKQ